MTEIVSKVPFPIATETRNVRIRPVRPADYPFLYELAVDPVEGHRWRYRGSQPSYEEFVQRFRDGVLANFIVEAISSGARVGYVACYRADFRNQYAYIAVQGRLESYRTHVLVDGLGLFIDLLFANYGFRKLYAECPEFNVSQVRSCIGRQACEEGRLRDHEIFRGQAWDLHILAVYGDQWRRYREEFAQRRLSRAEGRKSATPLGVDGFLEYVNAEIGATAARLESRLAEDLNLDSLGVFELVSAIEDLGVSLKEEDLAKVATLDDVYFLYVQAVA